MNRLIRTELLKQRTLRTFVAGVAAVPVITGLVAIAILTTAGKQGNNPLSPDTLTQIIGGPAAVVTLVALLLGVLGMAGETRHQTITTTFLATPRRRNVVIAKLAAHARPRALIGGLTIAISAAIAVPWLHASGIDIQLTSDGVRVAAGLVASTALDGALGVAVGAIFRNRTVAVAVVLTWLLAVEGIIGDLLHDPPSFNGARRPPAGRSCTSEPVATTSPCPSPRASSSSRHGVRRRRRSPHRPPRHHLMRSSATSPTGDHHEHHLDRLDLAPRHGVPSRCRRRHRGARRVLVTVGCSGSIRHNYRTFQSALDRGASCQELFDQRSRFNNADTLAEIDRDLARIGWTSPEATRSD